MTGKKIDRLWLMVHPGCEGNFTQKDLLEYRRIIDAVARDPNAGFIVAPAYHGKGLRIEEGLMRYARQKIPKDRLAVLESTGKIGRNPFDSRISQKARMLAFGSYLAASNMECAASASEELKIPRKNVTLLPRYSVHYSLSDIDKRPEMGLLQRSGEKERGKFRSLVRSWGFNTEPMPPFQQRLRRLRKR